MFHNIYNLQKFKYKPKLGFSLVEMLVSISILVMVMTLILARQDAFDSAVLLRSQAYEIALAAREVQLYSVSVTGDGSDFRTVYGLHFDTADGSVYKIFKDDNGNNFYDSGEEFGKQESIDPRFVIDEIRVGTSATIETELSVVFERPNFDAHFFDGPSSELSDEKIEIDVRLVGTTGDSAGEVRTLEFTRTGQISVN